MLPPSRLPANPLDLLALPLRRHPYFFGSLLIHAALLWALSQWHSQGLAEAELRANQAQIQAHTQAAQHHALRRRVDRIQAMKTLAERIARAQATPDGQAEEADKTDATDATDAASPTPNEADAQQPAPSPQELLTQARELRDSVQRIEQAAKAKKMAEVLNLPPEQALKQVQQQAAEAAKREAAADADAATPQTSEQVDAAFARYEQQARESTQRLQAQHEQQRNGTPTQHAASGGPAQSGPPGQGAAGSDAPSQTRGGGSGGGQSRAGGPADTRRSSVVDAQPRRYAGPQQTAPVIQADQLRLGAGNSVGAGAALANRVLVDRWYWIGPFHAPSPQALQQVYPPEQWVDLDGVYLGKGQRVLRWQYVSSASYPLVPPDYAEQAIYYAYAEIRSDRARDVWLALGADDDAKLWLNEQVVWTSGNQRKAWYTTGGVQSLQRDIQLRNLIEARVPVHLRAGRNTVLFKLYNNPLDVFFSLLIEPAASER
jgi:hypothetical protein